MPGGTRKPSWWRRRVWAPGKTFQEGLHARGTDVRRKVWERLRFQMCGRGHPEDLRALQAPLTCLHRLPCSRIPLSEGAEGFWAVSSGTPSCWTSGAHSPGRVGQTRREGKSSLPTPRLSSGQWSRPLLRDSLHWRCPHCPRPSRAVHQPLSTPPPILG